MAMYHLQGCQVPGKHAAGASHYDYDYEEAANWKGKKLAWESNLSCNPGSATNSLCNLRQVPSPLWSQLLHL